MHRYVLALLIASSGCVGNNPDAPDTESNESSILAAQLAAASRSDLNSAVANLTRADYVRERKVEVTDEKGSPLVAQTHTTRFSGPEGSRVSEVLRKTEEGGGDASFWEQYTQSPVLEDTVEWGARLLPKDPLVLTEQGAAYYDYRIMADTVVDGTTMLRIETSLRSDTQRQGIQTARFYLDAASEHLVGFDLVFVHQSLLFDEESLFHYRLQPSPEGKWVAAEVDIRTLLNMPLTKGQRFLMHTVYRDLVYNVQ